MAANLMVVWFS